MAFLRCDFSSKTLQMATSAQIILPDEGDLAEAPVVYLLHGLSDNCTGWQRYTAVERYARQYGVAVVMPEVQRSFYTDMRQGLPYFTYISSELPQICARMFGLRGKTYVMGLSMGGYGALKCALRSPARYAGVAAFSAVADLAEYVQSSRENSALANEFAALFGSDLQPNEQEDLLSLAEKCAKTSNLPPFFLTCGEQDALAQMNKRLEAHLNRLGYPLRFEWAPGAHEWEFWDSSVQKAFHYFFGIKKEP